MLEINQQYLIKAYELQNRLNIEESVNMIEKIYKNFHNLGLIADQIPFTPTIIRENREILSSAHLEKLNERIPDKMNYEFTRRDLKPGNKKKQTKIKWSSREHELFLEGLNMYGLKSKNKFQS